LRPAISIESKGKPAWRVLARGRGPLPAQTDQAIALSEHKRTPHACVIADDDPAVRSVLALAIVRCGLEPQGFGTAREVLEACRRDAPDLLFLDVALQGSDAIDVIRALGERRFRGAVQLVSGHHGLLEHVRRVGERYGLRMLTPLNKPFRAGQVEQIVEKYLAGHADGSEPSLPPALAADSPPRS
jgi:DNA-binding NtrC family response regulator